MPVKRELYKGTDVQLGYNNPRHDRRVITCFIEGTGTGLSLDVAIGDAIGTSGTSSVGVPLFKTRAYRITDNKAMVTLEYSNEGNNYDESLYTGIDAGDMVWIDIEYEYDMNDVGVGSATTVYTPPSGGGGSVLNIWRWYYYKRGMTPVQKIRYRSLSGGATALGGTAFVGNINGGTTAIGPNTYDAKTLRYDGAQVAPSLVRTGTAATAFEVRYEMFQNYTWKATGWTRNVIPRGLFKNTTLPPIQSEDLYGTAAF